jgi:hypothetical protein
MNEVNLARLISVKRRNPGTGKLGQTTSNRGVAWVGKLARQYGADVIRSDVPSGLVGPTDPHTSVVYSFPDEMRMLEFIVAV